MQVELLGCTEYPVETVYNAAQVLEGKTLTHTAGELRRVRMNATNLKPSGVDAHIPLAVSNMWEKVCAHRHIDDYGHLLQVIHATFAVDGVPQDGDTAAGLDGLASRVMYAEESDDRVVCVVSLYSLRKWLNEGCYLNPLSSMVDVVQAMLMELRSKVDASLGWMALPPCITHEDDEGTPQTCACPYSATNESIVRRGRLGTRHMAVCPLWLANHGDKADTVVHEHPSSAWIRRPQTNMLDSAEWTLHPRLEGDKRTPYLLARQTSYHVWRRLWGRDVYTGMRVLFETDEGK